MSKHWTSRPSPAGSGHDRRGVIRKGKSKSGKPILHTACGGSLIEHKGPQGFTCYNCDKEFPPGTLAEMIGVPDGEGGEKWVFQSVDCYELPPPTYVDGKTNVGPDGELVDRVLEPDEK